MVPDKWGSVSLYLPPLRPHIMTGGFFGQLKEISGCLPGQQRAGGNSSSKYTLLIYANLLAPPAVYWHIRAPF